MPWSPLPLFLLFKICQPLDILLTIPETKSCWKILRLAFPLGSDRLFLLSHSEDRQHREKEVARECGAGNRNGNPIPLSHIPLPSQLESSAESAVARESPKECLPPLSPIGMMIAGRRGAGRPSGRRPQTRIQTNYRMDRSSVWVQRNGRPFWRRSVIRVGFKNTALHFIVFTFFLAPNLPVLKIHADVEL